MTYRANYPRTVAEVLNPPLRFKPATIEAVRTFARSKPWRGSNQQRMAKMRRLHGALCSIYGKSTTLTFEHVHQSHQSGASCYIPALDMIVMRGRLSVVTYLHEFGHVLGKDERQTVRWSVNLFRQCFPRSFARCRHDGHMLVRSAA